MVIGADPYCLLKSLTLVTTGMHFERLYRLDIVIASLVRFFSLRYSLQDVVGYFAAGNWALYRRSTGGVPTADPAEFRTHRPVANELPAVRAARLFLGCYGRLWPIVVFGLSRYAAGIGR